MLTTAVPVQDWALNLGTGQAAHLHAELPQNDQTMTGCVWRATDRSSSGDSDPPLHCSRRRSSSQMRLDILWNELLEIWSNWSGRSSSGGSHSGTPSRHRCRISTLCGSLPQGKETALRHVLVILFSLLHAPRLARSGPGNFDYVFRGNDGQQSGPASSLCQMVHVRKF